MHYLPSLICQICVVSGWQPVDIGPRSLEEMTYFLSECKVLDMVYIQQFRREFAIFIVGFLKHNC